MSSTEAAPAKRSPQRIRWTSTDIGLIAVFAALVAVSAVVPGIPVGALGVPITIQTLAVMLTGLVLGGGRAFAAVGLYTLLGFAGLPIFSGGRSGLGILATPSAGYIIAFPLAAAAAGWLAARIVCKTNKYRTVLLFAAAMLCSIVLIHGLGVVGFMVNGKFDFAKAFLADLPYYPGDTIKNVLAAVIAVALHKAFPDILVRRARRANNTTSK
ncbi:biotin transporter BioY [Arthrobacter sp. NyZ413]|uniref:biotin transporter BioY n=1 Tax=Arthrobacter sp. NyZ413 TaxID=3144669 RepID=UPI003BF840BF